MFFKQVRRNSAKNRKGNGLFFGTLIIAIVAFYTLLSLGEQDVMRFLATIESDAVHKLLALLPAVYLVSLFFVFFLVYFACSYQTQRRQRELGMYLMLGMKRSRMFTLLFCETLWSSLVALFMGIFAALFLTEGISLATAKLVGLGIVGHRISFSLKAVFWTACGFVLVQLLSMFIICLKLGKKEPAEFLRPGAPEKQRQLTEGRSLLFFISGTGLLLAAYGLGIFRLRTLHFFVFLAVLVCGIAGTFLFYRGLGGFLGKVVRRKRSKAAGLSVFTARQIQEHVFSQHKSLAVSALLLLMAFSCIAYGAAMGLARTVSVRSADFSLFGEEPQIDRVLKQDGIRRLVKESYPMYLSMVKDEYFAGEKEALDLSGLGQALESIEDTENIVQNMHIEYVIAESSYNELLKAMGKEGIQLHGQEVALYTSMAGEGDFGTILKKAVEKKVSVGIRGKDYALLPALYYDNVVADRAITLSMALIVPDALFGELAREPEAYCRNVRLRDDVTQEPGLMQAVQKMDEKLAKTGIEYDSFLGGIGRNLFYTVSASYLTIYLGVLFLLISNTVLGLKFLIQHRQNKCRYRTLSMLGADTEAMCRSAKKQIQVFFLLVLTVASVSGAAAVVTMFTSFAKLPVGTSMWTAGLLAATAFVIFVIIELVYIGIVRRTAQREICSSIIIQ